MDFLQNINFNIFEIYMNFDWKMQVLVAAAVVILILGFLKKALWLCVVAAVIIVALFTFRPEVAGVATDFLVEKTNNALNPLADDEYTEYVEETEK